MQYKSKIILKSVWLIFFSAILLSCNQVMNNGEVKTGTKDSMDNSTFQVKTNEEKVNTIDDNKEVSFDVSYRGKVGDFPIEMKLTVYRKDNRVYGSYRYTKFPDSDEVILSGEIVDNVITIEEYKYKKGNKIITGNFDFRFDNLAILNGTWTKPDLLVLYDVELKSLENLQGPPLSFTYERDIKKVLLGRYADSEEKYKFTKLDQLRIYDQGQLIQTIEDLDIVTEENHLLKFEDLNFDGYLDLKIVEYYPFSTNPDYGIIHFIYDPSKKKFERNEELNELRVVRCDPFKKKIISYTADGRGNESETIYKWQGKSLKIIKRIEYFEDSDTPQITIY